MWLESFLLAGLLRCTGDLCVDDRIASTIASQVEEIVDAGYARRLDATDLFHGHFLVEDGTCTPTSKVAKEFPARMDKDAWLQEFLARGPHFLYHTRESEGMEDLYGGPPRSIIGNLDGTLSIASSKSEEFRSHGTVYGTEPFSFGDHQSQGMCYAQSYVKMGGRASTMQGFFIFRMENGRYSLRDGTRFDIFYNPSNMDLWMH